MSQTFYGLRFSNCAALVRNIDVDDNRLSLSVVLTPYMTEQLCFLGSFDRCVNFFNCYIKIKKWDSICIEESFLLKILLSRVQSISL